MTWNRLTGEKPVSLRTQKCGAHRQSGSRDLYAVLNKGGGVGVWDFEGEKGNSRGNEKKKISEQAFAMPRRDKGTQRGLWSPSPAEFPSPHLVHSLCSSLRGQCSTWTTPFISIVLAVKGEVKSSSRSPPSLLPLLFDFPPRLPFYQWTAPDGV